jgi:hypothetical protein
VHIARGANVGRKPLRAAASTWLWINLAGAAAIPPVAVSGATGEDLEKRIVRVMTRSPRIKLGFGRKLMRRLMLAMLDVAVLAIPVICGYVSAPHVYAQSPRPGGASSPSFEVASVKQNRSENSASMMRVFPHGFSLKNGSTKALVTFAYGVRDLVAYAQLEALCEQCLRNHSQSNRFRGEQSPGPDKSTAHKIESG